MSSDPDHTILIVGGGISGLSAAYYLKQAGIRATVVEKARPGGVIQTTQRDACVLEAGPDSFLAQKPWALDLIRALGLDSELIGSNDPQRITYILRHGKLTPLPDGLIMMVPTRIWPMLTTPLLGWSTKLRMGADLIKRPHAARPERSVSGFLREHYSQEAIDYLAEPLLAGVYGGDPEQLSATAVLPRFVEIEAKYGSLSRGVLAQPRPATGGGSLFQTLKAGLGMLVEKLAEGADILPHAAETIEARDARGFRVRVNGSWISADQVIAALPAPQAGALFENLDRELAALLSAIPYSSSITLALVYDRQALGRELKGFGLLVPRQERRDLVACTIVNNKFPFRAPANKIVLRCFLGGNCLAQSDAELEQIARRELRRILNITAEPLFTQIARWPQSMAQYTVGHGKRVADIEARLGRFPGLHLAGNAYHGIGLPDCVRSGKLAAERAAALCAASAARPAPYHP